MKSQKAFLFSIYFPVKLYFLSICIYEVNFLLYGKLIIHVLYLSYGSNPTVKCIASCIYLMFSFMKFFTHLLHSWKHLRLWHWGRCLLITLVLTASHTLLIFNFYMGKMILFCQKNYWLNNYLFDKSIAVIIL